MKRITTSIGRHCNFLELESTVKFGNRVLSDDALLRSSQNSDRTKAVTSYYFQSAIDQAAVKVSLVFYVVSLVGLLVCHSLSENSLALSCFREQTNKVYLVEQYIISLSLTTNICYHFPLLWAESIWYFHWSGL